MAMTKGVSWACILRVRESSFFLLVIAFSFLLWQPVHANPAEWESVSSGAYGSTSAPCVPCHSNSFIQKPNLQVADVSVASTSSSATVSMTNVVPATYLAWRFRPINSGINGTFVTGASSTVAGLGSGANDFEFCVVENTANTISADGPTGTVSWNCADFTISRNQLPAASLSSGGNLTLEASGSETVTVNASDADGDALGYTAQSNNPAVATVAGPTGTSAFSVSAAGAGSTSIDFTVTDSKGESTVVSLSVTVNPGQVNQAPSVSINPSGSTTLVAGESLNLQATGSDPDSDSLSYSASSSNASVVSVTGDNSTGSYVVAADANVSTATNATVTVTVSDGDLTSSASLNVNVTPISQPNRDPVLTVNSGASRTVAINAAIDITASATDADNNALSFNASSRNGAVASVTQPDSNVPVFRLQGVSAGSTQVDFTVNDGNGGSDTTTINVLVEANPEPNQAPVISLNTGSDIQLTSGQTQQVQATATDAENDPVTFSAQSGDTAVASVAETGSGNYLITAGSTTGSTAVTFTASDAGGSSTTAVTVTVTDAVNSAPVIIGIEPLALNLIVSGSASFTVNANDTEDGTNLQYTASSSNTAVVAVSPTSANGAFQVTAGGVEGSATITIEVRDTAGQSVSVALTVNVAAEVVVITDADQDGVVDILDNCPNDANSADSNGVQLDTDNDGSGDICDPDANGDSVLDGVLLLDVMQSGRTGNIVFPGDGAVEVQATVSSGSLTESNFSIDWSASDSTIRSATASDTVSSCDATTPTQEVCGRLSLNPSGFSSGVYTARATAMVDGLPVSASVDLLVMPGAESNTGLFDDADGDGFPRESGSDALSANPVNVSTGNNANRIFAEGFNTIALGRYAALHWSKQNFSQSSVVLRYEQFLPVSLEIHRALSESNTPLVDNAGVFNFNVETRGPVAQPLRVIIHLPGAVPAEPDLLIFKPDAAADLWQSFNGTEDSVRAASSNGGICPGFDDNRYTLVWGGNGASAAAASGADCLQFSVRDGGANDTDGVTDGVVSLAFNLGNDANDCAGCDGLFIPINNGREDLDLNPSSGGGSGAPRDLMILIGLLAMILIKRSTRRRGFAKYT